LTAAASARSISELRDLHEKCQPHPGP